MLGPACHREPSLPILDGHQNQLKSVKNFAFATKMFQSDCTGCRSWRRVSLGVHHAIASFDELQVTMGVDDVVNKTVSTKKVCYVLTSCQRQFWNLHVLRILKQSLSMKTASKNTAHFFGGHNVHLSNV